MVWLALVAECYIIFSSLRKCCHAVAIASSGGECLSDQYNQNAEDIDYRAMEVGGSMQARSSPEMRRASELSSASPISHFSHSSTFLYTLACLRSSSKLRPRSRSSASPSFADCSEAVPTRQAISHVLVTRRVLDSHFKTVARTRLLANDWLQVK